MIHAVIVMNTEGKLRLSKFYNYKSPEEQPELIRRVYGALCRRPENVSNFVDSADIFGSGTQLVYKHYATLYFVFVFDNSENELAMLDLIQVFVETLDKCFKNVCEVDIVFNFNKMHAILNEIVFGGQVLETSSDEVMRAVEEITRLEKTSTNPISFVPKSVSGRFGR
ncbi:putative AP-3 complex subunit sigma-1 [Zostera marina]|uniref:AP complex subunit sigma n=1 Tax=Zostera marina TaxID=29655 RepID=A0A0K9P7L6_ZOSMR|nr:putative AP-3 complex subunit sigma-1 [Zostera marina]